MKKWVLIFLFIIGSIGCFLYWSSPTKLAKANLFQANLGGISIGTNSVLFSPDAKWIAATTRWPSVVLLDLRTQTTVTLSNDPDMIYYSAIFSPDGCELAVGGFDKSKKIGTVDVWNIATQSKRTSAVVKAGYAKTLAYSPDGTKLAIGGKQVLLFDVASMQEVRTLSESPLKVNMVAFSSKGSFFGAAGGDDSKSATLVIWSTKSWEMIANIREQVTGIESLIFSPDERFIISGPWEDSIKIHDLSKSGAKFNRSITVPGATILTSSSDGKWVTTIGDFGLSSPLGIYNGKIWDANVWKQLAIIKGHRSLTSCGAFSPDGKILASGGLDGIILWDTSRLE